MIDNLLNKLDLMVRFLQNPEKEFLATYITNQKKILEKIKSGKPYILSTYYFPSELTNIFDVEFIYIERIVGLSIGGSLFDSIDEYGLPKNCCSYQKAFLTLIVQNLLPLPKMIIAFDYPCNDAKILCKYLHIKYNVPIHYLSVSNMTEEFKRIYYLLIKKFQIKQSIEKTVELSNHAAILKQKIDFYRMKYPGIIKSDDCLKVFTVENDFGGNLAISVLEQIFELIIKNTYKYTEINSLRIFWMGLIPLYNNNILLKVEKALSCRFVYEEMWMFGNNQLTSKNFFEDLSKKVKSSLFFDVGQRIKNLVAMIKATKADVVINFTQKNCSFLPQTIPQIKSRLIDENIAMYNIEADVILGDFKLDTIVKLIENHMDRMNINDRSNY